MTDGIPDPFLIHESSSVLLGEHTQLQGTFLAAIAYGIELILYVMTCSLLWKRRRLENRKQKLFSIGFVAIIFVLSTLYIAALLQYSQLASVDDRYIQNGSILDENSRIVMFLSVILVIKSWFCDIINLWRSFVIYEDCRISSWVVNTIPILLYITSIVLGIFCLGRLQLPALRPSIHPSIIFLFPSFTVVSLGLNILVTLLLALRLLSYRRHITKLIGTRHGSKYASLAAIIVESAAIHSFAAVLFIATRFSTKARLVSQAFGQMLSPLQGVSTFLIFLRVAEGKHWTKGTYESTIQALSTLQFADETNNGGLSWREIEERSPENEQTTELRSSRPPA